MHQEIPTRNESNLSNRDLSIFFISFLNSTQFRYSPFKLENRTSNYITKSLTKRFVKQNVNQSITN